jgi:hypothetical protein
MRYTHSCLLINFILDASSFFWAVLDQIAVRNARNQITARLFLKTLVAETADFQRYSAAKSPI